MSNEKASTDLCRENGWGVGTVLEGRCSTPDYQYGICLEITLVSETGILAQIISRRDREGYWRPARDFARVWDLTRGTWKAVVWDQTLATWEAVPTEPAAGSEIRNRKPLIMDELCSLWALRKYSDRTDDDGSVICQLSSALADACHRLFEFEEMEGNEDSDSIGEMHRKAVSGCYLPRRSLPPAPQEGGAS